MARFILLLESDQPLGESEDWTGWVDELDAAGFLESAELMANQNLIVTADSAEESIDALGAYAIIVADGLEQAAELAAAFPHITGTTQISVRPLADNGEPTEESTSLLIDDETESDVLSRHPSDDEGFVR